MIENDGLGMGVRDIYTYYLMKQKGYEKVYLTGCPAWYDLDFVDDTQLQNDNWDIKKVCISDPADPQNYKLIPNIINYLFDRFPSATLYFIFHRGISKANLYLSKIKSERIKILNIAGSEDGFKVYNDADLHVGFRVHAHIYSLSRRRKTILIEEDGRGAGVNESLGIPSLRAYDDSVQLSGMYIGKIERKLRRRNLRLIETLDSYIQLLIDTKNIYYANAFTLQKQYFNTMQNFIRSGLVTTQSQCNG